MSLRAGGEQQERRPELAISRRTISPTGVTANAVSNSKVTQNDEKSGKTRDIPSDQCYSRLNKLRAKSIKEYNTRSDGQSIAKLNPEERVVWKNSKLFSKTLSNIDGIRPAKRANANQTNQTLLSVTREYSATEANRKNSDTTPGAVSPERATTHSSAAGAPAATAPKPSEWKLLKSKLSLLRKKGNKEMSPNANDNTIIGRDVKEVNCNASPSISKQEKFAQLLVQSSIPTTESILTKKTQEKGIICKKEDLMHIISEASKGMKASKTKPVNSDEDERDVLCAGVSHASTSSASTNVEMCVEGNAAKRQPSSRSESPCDRHDLENSSKTKHNTNARNECYDCCEPENSCKNQYNSNTNATNPGEEEEEEEEDGGEEKKGVKESVLQNADQNQNECKIRLKDENKSSIRSKRIAINETNLANSETHNKGLNECSSDGSAGEAAVQWDDINLDPLLLGDAIQAFLQGLGSSSVGTTASNEKRVSFKKSF